MPVPVNPAAELESFDPFAVPEPWSITLSTLGALPGSGSLFSPKLLDLPLFQLESQEAGWISLGPAFELPDTAAFAHSARPPPDGLPADASPFHFAADSHVNHSDPAGFNEAREVQEVFIDDNVWAHPTALATLKSQTRLLTWESFLGSQTTQAVNGSRYVSEAGPKAFDAVLDLRAQTSSRVSNAGRVVKCEPFLDGLFTLGRGISSTLFPYHSDTETFTRGIEDARFSGTSRQLCDSIVSSYVDFGEAVTRFRGLEDACYGDAGACAAKVALASVVRTALDAIEGHLITGRRDVHSLLQLQALFERPRQLISMLEEVVDRTGRSSSDADIASSLFETLQYFEDRGEHVGTLQSVFARVSQPWLDDLGHKIGLRQDTRSLSPFEVALTATRPSESFPPLEAPDLHDLPIFVSEEDAGLILETTECIQFMRKHHPDHPLSLPGKLNSDKIGFCWSFQWDEINKMNTKVEEYQQSVQLALTMLNAGQNNSPTENKGDVPALDGTPGVPDPWLPLGDDDPLVFHEEPWKLEVTKPSDALRTAISAELTTTRHAMASLQPPSILLSQYSLHPLVAAQHQLLTTATVRCVLLTHCLHTHLQTLHQFHLFASGIFTSSLTHVLFSSAAEAAERHKGVFRSGLGGFMGLRLGSGQRREWPPTSSELSLALLGVLDISNSSVPASSQRAQKAGFDLSSAQEHDASLLSFALRSNLPPSSIEEILDADSIYALDFLKLVYTPPAALQIIFTDQVLEKYDRIFKLLLRLLRVKFVLRELFSSTCGKTSTSGEHVLNKVVSRFHHRATTFINTILTHMRYAGIEAPWSGLMAYITSAAASLPGPATTGTCTLASLKSMHERTLDTILSSLFLRHQQRRVYTALEDICGDVLTFAKLASSYSARFEGGDAEELCTQYAVFDEHMRAFNEALCEAAERAEMGKGRRGVDVKSNADGHGEKAQHAGEDGMAEYLGALKGILGA